LRERLIKLSGKRWIWKESLTRQSGRANAKKMSQCRVPPSSCGFTVFLAP
jgi:hypothetical protein